MRLKIKRIGRRGVTLVELVIVLALVAIISTDVVVLTRSLNHLVEMNSQTFDDITNLSNCRIFIENWFYSFDDINYEVSTNGWTFNYNERKFVIDTTNKPVIITDGENNYTFSVEGDNILVLHKGADEVYTYNFSGLKKIEFENYEDTRLYKCIISYGDDETFSFVMGRRSE